MTVSERLTGTEPPEVIERHKDRYRRCIALAERTGGVWWDVGCGSGYGTYMMPADVQCGFDKQYPEDRLLHGHDFYKADIAQAGWSSEARNTPDVILCIETLEHLHKPEQDGLIREFANRLHPDGIVVIACPLGTGKSGTNPWHMHEPSEGELYELLFNHFGEVWVGLEAYESTSGPAMQAYATARRPR
jgi:hypothetical protein